MVLLVKERRGLILLDNERISVCTRAPKLDFVRGWLLATRGEHL